MASAASMTGETVPNVHRETVPAEVMWIEAT
jgi:hypothetical protein